jgi:UDP-N-acetylglucosamine 2-epimerase (non-hydrolysing)
MKIVTIIGARPQFIKHAALSKEVKKKNEEILIHTGQHYDYNMNKVFFDELGISEPTYNLGIGSGSHAYQTGEMLKGIEGILLKENPDLVIVYGDTNSTLAGALAAVKIHIKIAHVESGLRMFDKSIPEEINRVVTDYCANYNFCPTETAVHNLKKEGITKGVFLTGDVMVDTLNFYKETAEHSNILDILELTSKHYIVVTVHRQSNTDNRKNLEDIANAIMKLSTFKETIVFPVHPRSLKLLHSNGLLDRLKEKVKIIEPLGYLEFLKLLNHAKKVITDSGGIQKEAYILKVPCITLMESTPWLETVKDGWNVLAGTDTAKVIELALDFEPNGPNSNLFGLGACKKIVKIIDNSIIGL